MYPPTEVGGIIAPSDSPIRLNLAKVGLFQVRWSPDVLDEMERNMANRAKARDPKAAAKGARWARSEMERAFPDALVDPQAYTPLIEVVRNDAKDRHVLAAAIVARANVIITFNTKHFPQEACSPYGVEVLDPDRFLVHQLGLAPELVLDTLKELSFKRRPPMDTLNGILQVLEKRTPEFSAAARALVGGQRHRGVRF